MAAAGSAIPAKKKKTTWTFAPKHRGRCFQVAAAEPGEQEQVLSAVPSVLSVLLPVFCNFSVPWRSGSFLPGSNGGRRCRNPPVSDRCPLKGPLEPGQVERLRNSWSSSLSFFSQAGIRSCLPLPSLGMEIILIYTPKSRQRWSSSGKRGFHCGHLRDGFGGGERLPRWFFGGKNAGKRSTGPTHPLCLSGLAPHALNPLKPRQRQRANPCRKS